MARASWLFTLLGALTLAPAVAAEPSPAPVTLPELLAPLRPEYPSNGTSDARVLLEVTLDKTGAVTDVVVVDGIEPFASAAVRATRAARFVPARRGADAIAATITVAIDFTFAAPESAPVSPAPALPPQQVTPSGGAPSVSPEDEAIDILVLAPRVDDTERPIGKAEARMTAGTFGDPLRAVELLPGVTPLISGVPYFFVRGAPAGSVNFYIDEARIPQLYHVGPGSSVLHPQFVEAVALRSGPYRARYGDATSGVVTTRVVTEINDFGAEVEGKVFESAAYMGAPLGSGDGAAAVAGKVSHLGPLLDAINPQLRLNYWDYQSLVAYDLTTSDQVTLLLFGAGDFVGQEENGVVDVKIDTVFHRLKLGYNRNLGSGVDLHNYAILGLEQSSFDRVNETYKGRSVGVGTSLSYVVDETWEWATGASADVSDIDASGASESFGDSHNAAVSRVDSQIALWGEGRFSPGRRMKLDAGVRLAGYQSMAARAAAIEPRLSSTLDLAPRWKSIWALGVSTQVPTAGVPAPAVRPAELRGDLQRALQRALTVRYSVPLQLTAEATGFYNDYFNLSDPLSLTTTPDPLAVGDTADGSEPPSEELNFDDRPNGRSFGLEVLLRRPFTNALSGSIGYTLSRSTRQIGAEHVLSSFDRTHVLNTTAGYDFGSGYALSTRFMVYSGLPVRRLGETGGRTGGRSDPFVRVDVRFSKEWELSWSQLMLIVEMLNATFEEEILGVSCSPAGCVTATFGPVTVPSVGLRGTFGGARSEEGDRTGLSR